MSKNAKAAGAAAGEEQRPRLYQSIIGGCSLAVDELTEEDAHQVCQWKYEGDYAIYNLSNWQTARFLRHGITDERRRKKEFRAIYDEEQQRLIGYFRLFRIEPDSVTLTLGLDPACCGRGYGYKAMDLIRQYASKEYPGKKLVLTVHGFNRRAIRCFTKAGFETKERSLRETPSGAMEIFLTMECEAQSAEEFLGICDAVPEPEAKGGSKRRKK